MFYWLVESQSSPSTDPLVLWLQGGPGCSGLIGLLTENGPFVATNNGQNLTYNPLSWTMAVNMLYIEAPVGVGFSYSPYPYVSNDTGTAMDNYNFLMEFMNEFPEYKGRDFWITGESYGGVYIPTLSDLIVSNSSSQLYSQFKGFMAGNPVFSCVTANYNSIQFNLLYWHGLVSFSNYALWLQYGCESNSNTEACEQTLNDALNEIGEIDQELVYSQPSLDPDNLYQDFCTSNATLEFAKDIPVGCTPDQESTYLNIASVQAAIHAKKTKWAPCSNKIKYTRDTSSMIPFYQDIFKKKPSLHVLVYSGDVDIMTVPFGFTQACLTELNANVVSNWKPWFVNGATAGYWEKYDTYTFATIKGAGHEAPAYEPLQSYYMFTRFLNTQSLDDASPVKEYKIQREVTQGARLRNFMSER